MSKAVTVLITGFGRFPGSPYNPSGPLARAVARRRRPALADVRRVLHIFETSYAAVDRDLPKLIAAHKPDIVLLFGLAGRTPQVRIETRARNTKSILFPDVTGHRPEERAIVRRRAARARPRPVRRPARRRTLGPRAHPPVARCRALSVQLQLLARARGRVPIRHAARAVHPHPAGPAQSRRRPGTQETHVARRARPRRRGDSARAARRAAPFRLIRCPATGRRFGRAS